MRENAHTAFFLVGPTAIGKTDVAHRLAERTGAGILSADSMLIYKGMDRGTAKPSPEELERFGYIGVDIVEPEEEFNLARYLDHVAGALSESECHPLIVAGGTGLYVKALIRGLDDAGEPDPELRAEAESVLERDGIDALKTFVRERAPTNYDRLRDKQNPRRLIRALESIPPARLSWENASEQRIVGLWMPREQLWRRIAERVDRMYSDGLLEEVEHLMSNHNLSRTARQAIGYKESLDLLRGDMTWQQARERICTRTRRLAKSQMNWFRNQENVDWINIAEIRGMDAVCDCVQELWRKNGRTQIRL